MELPLTLAVKDQTLNYQIATFQFIAFCLGFSPTIDCFRKTRLTLNFYFVLIKKGVEKLISPSSITILFSLTFGSRK